jgi:AAA family ATP:ADP antiporter
MKRWIERALNIHPGDLGRGTLLCACLFLVISTYKIGGVAGAALFLSRFHASQLAYVDIASALLVALVVAGYVIIARRVPLLGLLVGSMLFFASNCVLFWFLAHYYSRLTWLFPAFYVWVKIFGVLAATQVWTLANYVLTTREAKRVFGMVGGGAIAGSIFAGFFSKTAVKAFGTEILPLSMALFTLISAGLVILIWRSGQASVGGLHCGADQPAGTEPQNLAQSMQLVFSSPYLRTIAVVICVSSFVTTLTGWQFLAIAQQFLVKKDALAVFFGNFIFYASIFSLFFQLLLTTRLLRRFGLGPSLFALPTVVLLGSTGLLLFGTLASVVALKTGDLVLRYSLDRSTTELLYLPLPTRVKLKAKWFIDTVIWRLGDGLSGLTVLIFVTTLHLPARQISWIALLLVSVWLVAVSIARKQYVATLKASIDQSLVDVEQASTSVLDRSTTELLTARLTASDPNDILYALSMFEVERQRAVYPVVRSLLGHPAPQVRQKAITILSESGDKTVRPQIERLLRDPDLNVRTEALLYLTHHAHVDPLELIQDKGDFADFSVRSAVVAFLARPGETQILEAAQQILNTMVGEPGPARQRYRIEAARLLGELPGLHFDPLLANLLADPDPAVALEAIRSVGKLRKRRLVPDLLDRLTHRELGPECAKALCEFGDSIVGSLRDQLGDPAVVIEARREIPAILVKIATPAAAQVLMENLLESDTTLRFRIIRGLNKLHKLHPEVALDIQLLETVLAAEILGHYRSYQILDKLGTMGDSQEPGARALTDSMKQELERIFCVLDLLYPQFDLHAAYLSLQSNSVTVYDNALEYLDNVLKSQLRDLLVPLLDGKSTVAERARMANRLVRTKIENQEQAVAALVTSDDPWLRSCGLFAIGMLGIGSLEGELNRCLNDSDPQLQETAHAAKQRMEQSVRVAREASAMTSSARRDLRPLCDVDRSAMVEARLEARSIAQRFFAYCCQRSGCTRAYTPSQGYFNLQGGRILLDQFGKQSCPTCEASMYLAAYIPETENETWRCTQCVVSSPQDNPLTQEVSLPTADHSRKKERG